MESQLPASGKLAKFGHFTDCLRGAVIFLLYNWRYQPKQGSA